MQSGAIDSQIRADLDSPVLLPSTAPSHPLFPEGHYIVPDTNILLHCVHLSRQVMSLTVDGSP
jgi:hypothetical protein